MKFDARTRLWGVLLCVLVAAGCASLAELSNLASRLKDKDYTGVSVNHNTANGFDTLVVTAYNLDQQGDDGETIFRLVWDTYPEDIDRVVVTVNDKTTSATADELHKAYGARKVQPAGESGSGDVVAWILLVAFLALGGLLTAVIVRRRRRRPDQTMPPYPAGP
ncbi:hypothetical protein AB0K14_23235 [Actinosynnema sp. NPDC050801]|uniref:hypothetical protein n=1 Tax=unclassified Actinosynnema TaxID=2637065 RepID=UPI0033C50211